MYVCEVLSYRLEPGPCFQHSTNTQSICIRFLQTILFYHLKTYFIIYTIPFYITFNIPTFIFLFYSLK